MINAEQRQLLHQYIILDLTIKSLQYDYKKLEQLKMKAIYLPFVESLMKSVRQDYFNLKRKLAKQKIRVVGWYRINAYFSDVRIATAGEDEMLRYANQALKTEVEQLLIQLLSPV
ncbi:aconitate hydratase [Lysinibacillus fusiformis]|uniref:aconitate hydratase n=1 Tax=Lysinibacillus fusiformis TaxID=28031 RepID=UPI0035C0D475|nr:aconitate hydratase [Lysinibacillus fusiformis]